MTIRIQKVNRVISPRTRYSLLRDDISIRKRFIKNKYAVVVSSAEVVKEKDFQPILPM
jgi:hypothetical protein